MRVILATLALCLVCLGGCGQMGPLYMPADESAAAGDPAAGDPAAGAAAEGEAGAPATLETD